MSIKLLPEDVILKIAAGEVIERPASVVKELIENSIDAKATNIQIEFDDNHIKITDDGVGMTSEDLKMCHYRHATSKITSDEDLFNIRSLGFRGEALASIAAVSLMNIISKTADDEASSIIIEGGEIISESAAPFPFISGTQIEVTNLFYNTPARKKYMKTQATEKRIITEIVDNYILAHENITFKLIVHGRNIINTPSTDKLHDRFYQIYGKESKEMIDMDKIIGDKIDSVRMDLKDKGITIKGLISKPNIFRKNRNDQIIFVNGRLIKSGLIYNAISQAYKGFLNTGEQPIVVLMITIDPKKIDVNVHPTKQEIKFEDEKLIYQSIFHTINSSLLSSDLMRKAEVTTEKEIQSSLKEDIREESSNIKIFLENKPSQKIKNNVDVKGQTFSEQLLLEDAEKENDLKEEKKSSIRALGVFHKEFILAEAIDEKKLLIIDFHAAAERVNYEKLKKASESKNIETQTLLQPQIMDLSLSDFAFIIEHKEIFEASGYLIEEFGENSILIRSIPMMLGRQIEYTFIKEIIDDLKEDRKKSSFEELKDKIITRTACRASEKSGDNINIIQAQAIIDSIIDIDGNMFNCPHGRPTMIEFSTKDLEKMFKRIR